MAVGIIYSDKRAMLICYGYSSCTTIRKVTIDDKHAGPIQQQRRDKLFNSGNIIVSSKELSAGGVVVCPASYR
eukprot:scaffold203688_cov37-Prasinocladus_malaysianus.AAC.1